MKNFLFVCSQNRLRSPTAEQLFAGREGIRVASAGTNHDAENPLTPELVEWADYIFVMERAHRNKIQKHFRSSLDRQRIVCLDIPDEYEYMDPVLVRLLEARMARYLPTS
ncbi:low molecular weight protein tyrosine phosphatase family protein [Sphingomonas sp. BT-65]|uniref:low molecular weight protein tyrosine phosphatase family protein n=1 Tax=Sphingomonas sp. BT-65 TaxID=2989821 RepID=UPI002235876F|nr:low molecular weight protein tyrosine phosphatase family protein [Sphingomonas sp. BT-65]MCW4460536.1 low molecular weight protein tyrosine phosphatase family protein [Sphingomonas sp. BT-65]